MDVFFNPAYAKLYGKIEGISDTFYFSCAYGSVQNTYLLREISQKLNGVTYYDIVTPYGYGGPLVLTCTDEVKLMQAYHEAFAKYAQQHRIVCEFIRFHLFDNQQVVSHYYGQVERKLDDVIVDTTGTYDEIRMRYEHKVRKNVKKALENGLEMVVENNLNHLDAFLAIYYQTMQRNHARQFYYFKREYFQALAEALPDNFVYFHTLKDGVVIATELVLYSEHYAYSFLGGTDEAYYPMRPNDFLKDAAIRWCNRTGKKLFVLGGGYQKGDGIYQYKRSFTSAPDVPFYVGRAIFDQPVYDELVRLRAEDASFDANSDYFPLYRA